MPVNRSTRAAQNYCHKIRKAPLGASENIRCLGWGFFFCFLQDFFEMLQNLSLGFGYILLGRMLCRNPASTFANCLGVSIFIIAGD